MSVIGDLVGKCCDLSIGAVSLAFGDASGGQLAATALGGIGSLGVGMWASCEDRARDKAMALATRHLKQLGEFTDVAFVDAARLLKQAEPCRIDPARLAALHTADDLASGGAAYIVAQLRPEPDPGTADILRVALAAGVEARLADPAFLARLTNEFIREVARAQGVQLRLLSDLTMRVDEIAGKVDGMTRAELDELAGTWGVEDPASLGLLKLKSRLLETAEDAQRVSKQIATLEGLSTRIDNIRAAAADAVTRMALDEARQLIRDARQVHREEKLLEPLKQDALLAEQEAEIELLDHRPDAAFDILESAANSFAAVDRLEPARRRLEYGEVLYWHGLRYGDAGLALSERMIRAALTTLNEKEGAKLWGQAHNALAVALEEQGTRTFGAEGAALSAEAVESYRAALRIRTEADHPVAWAMTMQNLGIALQQQGKRTAGPEGAALLAEAVESYRAALRVRTEEDEPVRWAMTMQNLAGALQQQGTRTAWADGAALLTEAVESYRAALRAFTEVDHPVYFAGTTQNLALALQEQGTRTAGSEGTALLAEAVESYRAALQVYTEADHPVQWAMMQENMALLEQARADHDTCTDPRPHLTAGLAHVEAALTVYDPEHMLQYFNAATTLRDALRARLAGLV